MPVADSNNMPHSIWGFLNSSFGLFLLSSVVIGLVTFSYGQWRDRITRSRSIEKLDLEIGLRLQALAAMSEGVDQTRYSNLVNIGKVMAGDTKSSFYVHKPVFNDFDDKSITTLMWQLYLLISANERSEVKEAISQSNEIVNRIQQVRFAAANDLNDSGSAAHTKKRAHKTDDEDALNKEYGQADVYAKVEQLSKQVRWRGFPPN
jgi:hypothetical protein